MREICKGLRLGAQLLLLFALAPAAHSYSVLTHEAVIDTLWQPAIRPLLLKRYPTANEAQMREAHAYAYGGCIIQDLGYYPFGSRFFSDLTHYVRSGDFILKLIEDSHDMYEYAFALGALAHYASDTEGHPVAVNRSVPIMYPKLARKYGKEVTFEDDPKAHLLVEFSFDVVQVAGAGYQPDTYHNFIGFKVARSLLDRAFKDTYALSLPDLFKNEDLAIGTYRRAASEIIPQMTQIAWKKRRKEIMKLRPSLQRREFVYGVSRARYEATWGKSYDPHTTRELRSYSGGRIFGRRLMGEDHKPGLLARFLVFLFSIFPKVGPFRTLAFKTPTPQTEHLFSQSLNATLDRYRGLLAGVKDGRPSLANRDFDTGNQTRPGEYQLADATYSRLLDRLAERKFADITPELRRNILAFYSDLSAPFTTKKDKDKWEKTLRELDGLKGSEGGAVPAGQK
jgi:hypothetical protein